jgi:hypothetical protein
MNSNFWILNIETQEGRETFAINFARNHFEEILRSWRDQTGDDTVIVASDIRNSQTDSYASG